MVGGGARQGVEGGVDERCAPGRVDEHAVEVHESGHLPVVCAREASVQERELLEEERVGGVSEERRAGHVEVVRVLVLGRPGDVEVAEHQPWARTKGASSASTTKNVGHDAASQGAYMLVTVIG